MHDSEGVWLPDFLPSNDCDNMIGIAPKHASFKPIHNPFLPGINALFVFSGLKLDILEREVPATEKNPETSKKGQYRIKDNFLAFWFRFVYPMRSFIESGHPEIAIQKLKSGFIPNTFGSDVLPR